MKLNRLKLHIKAFLKNKSILLSTITLWLITVGMNLLFLNLGFPGFRTLYILCRYNFYISAGLSVVSYYYFTAATRSHCRESIDAAAGQKNTWQTGSLAVMLLVQVFFHLSNLFLLSVCSFQNDGSNYFIGHFFLDYLCNILLPQVICIGAAYVCSIWMEKSQMLSTSMLVLFLLMTSPIAEQFVWREKPEGFPIDQVMKELRWPFQIFYQNGNWAPDVQYGLQCENVRIFVELFWILLGAAILLAARYGRRLAPCCCGLAAFLFLAASCLPASLYRLNESWDGMIARDASHYRQLYREAGKENPEQSEGQFAITDYDLEVYIQNQLRVRGTIEIEADTPADKFVFTLYHGYRMEEITGDDMQVDMEQRGDQVVCTFPRKISKAVLAIRYAGKSDKFYSNSQAVMLPGYFPWYPMAGEKPVFTFYEGYGGGYGYYPYNRTEQAEFQVKLYVPCPVVSNLELSDDKGVFFETYRGKSDGITLIGGKILKVQDARIQNVLPLSLQAEQETEKYLGERNSRWEKEIWNLEHVYGIRTEGLKEKKVLMASKDLGRNNDNNMLAEFEDYLLVTESDWFGRTYIEYLLMQKEKESWLGDRLSGALPFEEDIDPEKVIKRLEKEFTEFSSMFKEGGAEEKVQSSGKEEFLQAKNHIQPDILLREIIQYLLYQDNLKDDSEFYSYLKTKYQY